MKVFVVTFENDWLEVIGVFDSREKAEKYINDSVEEAVKENLRLWKQHYRYQIVEQTLNVGI